VYGPTGIGAMINAQFSVVTKKKRADEILIWNTDNIVEIDQFINLEKIFADLVHLTSVEKAVNDLSCEQCRSTGSIC
jgi:hypothetical protein